MTTVRVRRASAGVGGLDFASRHQVSQPRTCPPAKNRPSTQHTSHSSTCTLILCSNPLHCIVLLHIPLREHVFFSVPSPSVPPRSVIDSQEGPGTQPLFAGRAGYRVSHVVIRPLAAAARKLEGEEATKNHRFLVRRAGILIPATHTLGSNGS